MIEISFPDIVFLKPFRRRQECWGSYKAMASSPAIGSAPISFVDGKGRQYSMPLSFISFASAGAAPDVSSWLGWAGASAEQAAITQWVATLVAQNLITPLNVPAPALLFTLTAASPGAAGNDITVKFNSVNQDGSLNVTVSTQQVYSNLTVSSVETVLGLTASGGTNPVLAYVSAPFTTLPPNMAVTPFTATPPAPYGLTIPGSGNGALTASYMNTNAQAAYITAEITASDPVNEVFTLTLAWTNTVSSVTPATLGSAFSYLLNVTPGPGTGMPAVPSTVTLVGGAAPSSSPAVAASAPVLST
jgi:hypothetical protein